MRKCKCLLLCAAILISAAPLASALEPGRYQTGLLLRASGAAQGDGNGGICYALVVRLADILYQADSCAFFPWNSYAPHEFVENGEVELRFDKDKMYLKRPNGKELRARIMRRVRVVPRYEEAVYQRYTLQTESVPDLTYIH